MGSGETCNFLIPDEIALRLIDSEMGDPSAPLYVYASLVAIRAVYALDFLAGHVTLLLV